MDPLRATEKQLSAIPGIGKKSAWSLVSSRAKALRKAKGRPPFGSVEEWFGTAGIHLDTLRSQFFEDFIHSE